MGSAVPLSRALLALAIRRASGAVEVRAGQRSACVELVDGQVVAVSGVDTELLGDTLLKHGALDTVAHARALLGAPPQGRVGRWLVEVGAAEEADVRVALELQLHARIALLLRWRSPRYAYESLAPGSITADAPRISLAAAVLLGVCALAREQIWPLAANDGGEGLPMSATALGNALVDTLERDGSALVTQVHACTQSHRSLGVMEAWALRRALIALGALAAARQSTSGYSLLLRKRRQLRAHVDAHTLLDLPHSAGPDQARKALRRLAAQLHPDKFDAADPAVRALSNEVLSALAHAERSLRRVG